VNLLFRPTAWEQWLYWQEADKATFRKLVALIKECQRHPFEGTGKPEPLKGDLAGCWSRRIDREHRLVYRVRVVAVEFLHCRFL
jgi:toxin YoeB